MFRYRLRYAKSCDISQTEITEKLSERFLRDWSNYNKYLYIGI